MCSLDYDYHENKNTTKSLIISDQLILWWLRIFVHGDLNVVDFVPLRAFETIHLKPQPLIQLQALLLTARIFLLFERLMLQLAINEEC